MSTTSQTHPLTGTDYRTPIYVTRDGTPRYAIGGAADPAPADAPPADAPPADAPPADEPPADTPPADAPPADEPPGDDDTVYNDPAAAKALVEKLRRENGSARTQAKADAATEAREEIVKEFGKMLGFIKDDDAPVDTTAALNDARSAQRETAAELVVWKEAAALKVDAQAVTDSRAFARAIKDLDPASDTFAAEVKAAAQEAAKNNPKLKAGPASSSSSVDHPGGGGGPKRTEAPSMQDAVNTALST